jgi:hypothetical protein
MPSEASHKSQRKWCDVDGAPIALLYWVEQVAERPGRGSRLHRRGEVVGRGPGVVYVRFAGERQLISVLPELLRLLPGAPERRW